MNAALNDALCGFEINTSNPLNSTGVDGVHSILPMIHGIAKLMEFGFRKNETGQAAFDNANPELVAAAFDGIGFLAATAMLHAEDL